MVILSGAKDLGHGSIPTPRSFAPLRMTIPPSARRSKTGHEDTSHDVDIHVATVSTSVDRDPKAAGRAYGGEWPAALPRSWRWRLRERRSIDRTDLGGTAR